MEESSDQCIWVKSSSNQQVLYKYCTVLYTDPKWQEEYEERVCCQSVVNGYSLFKSLLFIDDVINTITKVLVSLLENVY